MYFIWFSRFWLLSDNECPKIEAQEGLMSKEISFFYMLWNSQVADKMVALTSFQVL